VFAGLSAPRFAASGSVPCPPVRRASLCSRVVKASSNWIFCRLSLTSCAPYWPLLPFGPSRLSFPVRRALPFLPFRASVSIEWTDVTELLCPLLTSAPWSTPLRTFQSRSRDTAQISRGKLDRLQRTTAESTLRALDGYGLRGHLPARPTLTPPIRFLSIGSRLCSTLLSDPASRLQPLPFANPSPPSGWVGDSHPQAVEHARHTKRAPAEAGAAVCAPFHRAPDSSWAIHRPVRRLRHYRPHRSAGRS